MRFIQYSRKSSEGDERQVQSIPDQHAALSRLVEQQGLVIVEKFEEAKSAKRPGSRPLFERMIAMLSRGEADGILCWHLNRLSRNPVDSGQISWMLQQGLIKCIKTIEREYRPEDNVVIMAVENAVANQYIIDLRKNVARGQDEKAARGWYPFRPPGGYLINPITREVEIDPERFHLLRQAWDLMLTSSHLVPEILEKLQSWGYRTRRSHGKSGSPIWRSSLYQIFDNPFYYGEFDYKGKRIMGRHQPMVTRAEFDQVQSILHRKTHIQPKKHSFSFTGLIRCGGCGCLVTAEKKVKHYPSTNRTVAYTYYRCTRSKPCSEPCVTEQDVQLQIQDQLNLITVDPAALDWAEAAIRRAVETGGALAEVEQNYKRHMAGLEARLSRLLDMRLQEEISAEEFQSARDAAERELSNTKSALDRFRDRSSTIESTIGNMFGFLRKAGESFAPAPEKLKRQIATLLAESYLLTLGKLEVDLHPLLRDFATLEPPKKSKQQDRKAPSVARNPKLWSVVDNIVTLLRETDAAFPHIDFEQQVEDEIAPEASRPAASP